MTHPTQVRRRNRHPIWVWLGSATATILILLGVALAWRHYETPVFPTNYHPVGLQSGKPTSLIRGRRLTVVMLMASWCLYCAYEDKYVWPRVLRRFPGVAIDVVDVSPKGGIGNPGPETPPFTGVDGRGPAIRVAGMRATMLTYEKQFNLRTKRVRIFVDARGMEYWRVTNFPTLLFVNHNGRIVKRVDGALTTNQIVSLLNHLQR